MLVTCGKGNEDPSNVEKQEAAKVDAISCQKVLRYNLS